MRNVGLIRSSASYVAQEYYCLGKTVAESEALEYAKSSEFSNITVCPSIIIGPPLQPTMNASSLFLLTLLKGGIESLENKARPVVDVRDVAEALLLAYEKPEAKGRYICTSYVLRMQDLVNKLKSLYPNYNYPKSFTAIEEDVKMSSEKLQNLGWKYRPLDETIVDAVKRYEESGFLSKD
ncbi:hypothetical protein RGQ29_010129 [Quercus rubra]|uniref:NAD-dependent epimerase/dehydratase domain-containing protein n=1 Tax=Quercus rubra TaxID=3512 RepID=A0AAN7G214_QUERU|nr:hypothetical protein RGQ29_010129 [Quercus rubra]